MSGLVTIQYVKCYFRTTVESYSALQINKTHHTVYRTGSNVEQKQIDFRSKKLSSPVTGLEWSRGFPEVKIPRFHDNGTGWW